MEEQKIVIVGGGAGGLELAVGLAKKAGKMNISVILIDCEKTHVWKPHLHQIAAGSMYAQTEQLDYLHLANKFKFKFILGRFVSCDSEKQTIKLEEKLNEKGEVIIPEREISYDRLVMAIGSTSNDFGTKGVKEHSFSLDNLPTAEKFHNTMLEKAIQKEHQESDTPLTITIVGGGATGVELAAELTDTIKSLSQFGLDKLKKNSFQLNVINAADVLLPGLSPKISQGAKEILEDLKVNVLNSAKVIEITKNSTIIDKNNERIEIYSDLIVWAAGVKSSDALKNIPNLELTSNNQIKVTETLQAIGNKNIFVIGDCASIPWIGGPKEGLNVPPRAQAAHQMSDYLVKYMGEILVGEKVPPFIYKDYGSLISLGGEDTVGTLMGFMQGKSLFIEGKIAKAMYINLYQHHQIKINGLVPAVGMLVGKTIHERFKPKVKLY